MDLELNYCEVALLRWIITDHIEDLEEMLGPMEGIAKKATENNIKETEALLKKLEEIKWEKD